jgi:tetratricopeptide (TPR) repeat protein
VNQFPKYLLLIFACLAQTAEAAEEARADSIRKYRFLAKAAREKKEYAEAIGYYSQLLKYQPDDVTACFYLGEMYYQNKDLAGARQALGRAVELDSLHLNSNLRLYAVHLAKGAPDSAAQCLERVLLVNPEAGEQRRTLADLYRRGGRNREAIAHYERLVEEGQGSDELYSLLAMLHEEVDQAAQALEWRRRLAGNAQAGERSEQLEKMVALQLETQDVQGAYATLLELAELDSLNRYSFYSRLASIAQEHGHQNMRLKGLEGMVKANPRDLETMAVLVEWHLNKGNAQAADQWLERGLRIEPRNAHLQLLKGDALVRQGEEEAAIDAFELAKADPRWEGIAQQRIWQLRPPETEEEKLKRQFFGDKDEKEEN